MSKPMKNKLAKTFDAASSSKSSTEEVGLLTYDDEDEDEENHAEGPEEVEGEVSEREQDDDDPNALPSLDELKRQAQEGNGSSKTKKKTGVVYVANLPPGMKPYFLKSILSAHGNINRQYLEPEDETKRKRRVSLGGSSGLRYGEGWVEFETKQEAKDIALQLNGTRIGRKKGSRFYDDLWMIKYLKGFTWEMLVEKSIIQRKEREQRLRLELSKAKKEDEAFLQSVATSKRQKIRAARGEETEGDNIEKKRPMPKQVAPISEKKQS